MSRRCWSELNARRPRRRTSRSWRPRLAGGDQVDLLVGVLADVADRERVGVRGRRRSARGCAGRRSRSPAAHPVVPDEGVVGRDRVGLAPRRRRVDAQHLAEQRSEVLRRCGRGRRPSRRRRSRCRGGRRGRRAARRRCGCRTAGPAKSTSGRLRGRRERVRVRAAVLDDPRVALGVGVVDVEEPDCS